MGIGIKSREVTGIMFTVLRVRFDELSVLLHRYFLRGDCQTMIDSLAAQRLASAPLPLGLWRAHRELDGALDHGEGLFSAVHVPAASAPILDFHQLGIDLLELVLSFPLAQRPFRRPMNPGVRVVEI